jgi:hypothetical protein
VAYEPEIFEVTGWIQRRLICKSCFLQRTPARSRRGQPKGSAGRIGLQRHESLAERKHLSELPPVADYNVFNSVTPPSPEEIRHNGLYAGSKSDFTYRLRGVALAGRPALVGASGLRIALEVTEGNANDGCAACAMLAHRRWAISYSPTEPTIPTRCARTSPRATWANVKCTSSQRSIPAFSSFPYRYRNLVERFFNKRLQRDTRKAWRTS